MTKITGRKLPGPVSIPGAMAASAAAVYAIHESELWLTDLYAGGGFDFPDLGNTVDNFIAQSGGFEIVTHPGESFLSFLLPQPGFYRFNWHWTFDINAGYIIHGSMDDPPYFWEVQTRLDTATPDVLRQSAEVQTQIYTGGDGAEIRGSMNGVVQARPDRLHLTPLLHRYYAYPQNWFLGDGSNFYELAELEEGTHGFAIELVAPPPA